jgi:hypothetical protein
MRYLLLLPFAFLGLTHKAHANEAKNCIYMQPNGMFRTSATCEYDVSNQQFLFKFDNGDVQSFTILKYIDPTYSVVDFGGQKFVLKTTDFCFKQIINADKSVMLSWYPVYEKTDEPAYDICVKDVEKDFLKHVLAGDQPAPVVAFPAPAPEPPVITVTTTTPPTTPAPVQPVQASTTPAASSQIAPLPTPAPILTKRETAIMNTAMPKLIIPKKPQPPTEDTTSTQPLPSPSPPQLTDYWPHPPTVPAPVYSVEERYAMNEIVGLFNYLSNANSLTWGVGRWYAPLVSYNSLTKTNDQIVKETSKQVAIRHISFVPDTVKAICYDKFCTVTGSAIWDKTGTDNQHTSGKTDFMFQMNPSGLITAQTGEIP